MQKVEVGALRKAIEGSGLEASCFLAQTLLHDLNSAAAQSVGDSIGERRAVEVSYDGLGGLIPTVDYQSREIYVIAWTYGEMLISRDRVMQLFHLGESLGKGELSEVGAFIFTPRIQKGTENRVVVDYFVSRFILNSQSTTYAQCSRLFVDLIGKLHSQQASWSSFALSVMLPKRDADELEQTVLLNYDDSMYHTILFGDFERLVFDAMKCHFEGHLKKERLIVIYA